jgi:hypothetical protein
MHSICRGSERNYCMDREGSFPPNRTGYQSLEPAVHPAKCLASCRQKHMRSNELIKPDLLSEIVLLTFCALILASLVLFVMTTLAQS